MKSSPQLLAAIEVELALAQSRWRDRSIGLIAVEGSRGELATDALLLRRLRYFNQHGGGHAQVVERVPRLRLWDRLLLRMRNGFETGISRVPSVSNRGFGLGA